MATTQTYGKVIERVQRQVAQSGCDFEPEDLESHLANALMNVWTEICDDKFYRTEFTIPLVSGQYEYDLPEGVDKIIEIYDHKGRCLTDDGIWDRCANPPTEDTNYAHIDPCDKSLKGMRKQSLPCNFMTSSTCSLILTPTPFIPVGQTQKNITIVAHRKPSCDLYTIDGTTRTWKPIDLPPEYHAAFSLMMVGLSYLEVDPQQSQNYISLASDTIDKLKKKAAASVRGFDGPMYSKTSNRHGRGCKPCGGLMAPAVLYDLVADC